MATFGSASYGSVEYGGKLSGFRKIVSSIKTVLSSVSNKTNLKTKVSKINL